MGRDMQDGILSELDRRAFLKLVTAAGGALAFGGLLPACAGGGTVARKATVDTKAASSHLSGLVTLAPMVLADKLGYLQEEGIKQEVTEFAGGGDTVRAVTSGATNYGIAAPTATVAAFLKGEPLKLIGFAYGTTVIHYIVKSSSPYRSIKDLEGKKVAYSTPGSNSHYLALKSLRDAGVKAEVVSTGGAPETLTALKNGVVDAAWGIEPATSQAGPEVRILWKATDYAPNFVEIIVITTQSFASQQPEVLRGFLRAYRKAQQFAIDKRADAAKIWGEALSIPADIAKKSVDALVKEGLTTKIDINGLKAVEAGMLELGQIKEPVPWDKLIDQSFLASDLQTKI